MKGIFLLLYVLACINLQAQTYKTIECVAGGLSKLLTQQELNSVTNLRITGTINACDFLIMNDKMPLLAALDIKDVDIIAYSGAEWTYADSSANNMIPDYAFNNPTDGKGKESLMEISLPTSLISIGKYSFSDCRNLKIIKVNGELFPIISSYSFEDFDFSRCVLILSEGINLSGIDKFWTQFTNIERQ